MIRPMPFRAAPLALLLAGAALAQQPAPIPARPAAVDAARADPADPAASVPQRLHQSAFDGYRGWASPPAVGWKTANDTAAKIGGWRAYAREAAAPEPAASAAAPASGDAAPPPAVAPPAGRGSHSGHRMP